MARNYYAILGVDEDATQEEIKTAYREKVKKLHPDYYGQDSGPFRAVQEAYATLSDPARRKRYDDCLTLERCRPEKPAGPKAKPRGSQPGPVEPLIPTEPLNFEESFFDTAFPEFAPSFADIFDRFWHDFGYSARPRRSRAEHIDLELSVTASQARQGGEVRVVLPAQVICPACRGRGGMGFFECPDCFGQGVVATERPVALTFPAGISDHDAFRISLERLGFPNVYLTLHFRIRSGWRNA